MTNRIILFTALVCGVVATGFLLAQTPADPQGAGNWEMFSQRVAGTGGTGSGGFGGLTGSPVYGTVYLYNRRTGKVFRIFENCGESQPNGCMVPLPTLHDTPGIALPRPQSRGYGLPSD